MESRHLQSVTNPNWVWNGECEACPTLVQVTAPAENDHVYVRGASSSPDDTQSGELKPNPENERGAVLTGDMEGALLDDLWPEYADLRFLTDNGSHSESVYRQLLHNNVHVLRKDHPMLVLDGGTDGVAYREFQHAEIEADKRKKRKKIGYGLASTAGVLLLAAGCINDPEPRFEMSDDGQEAAHVIQNLQEFIDVHDPSYRLIGHTADGSGEMLSSTHYLRVESLGTVTQEVDDVIDTSTQQVIDLSRDVPASVTEVWLETDSRDGTLKISEKTSWPGDEYTVPLLDPAGNIVSEDSFQTDEETREVYIKSTSIVPADSLPDVLSSIENAKVVESSGNSIDELFTESLDNPYGLNFSEDVRTQLTVVTPDVNRLQSDS